MLLDDVTQHTKKPRLKSPGTPNMDCQILHVNANSNIEGSKPHRYTQLDKSFQQVVADSNLLGAMSGFEGVELELQAVDLRLE